MKSNKKVGAEAESSATKKSRAKTGNVFRDFGHTVFLSMVAVICLCLLSIVLLLTVQYSSILEEQVESRATMESESVLSVLNEKVSDMKIKSAIWTNEIIALLESDEENFNTFQGAVGNTINTDSVYDVLRCDSGKFYYSNGTNLVIKNTDLVKLNAAVESNELTFIGVVTVGDKVDGNIANMEKVAVCVPVENSEFCSATVVLFAKSSVTFSTESFDSSLLETSMFFALCTSEGDKVDLWQDQLVGSDYIMPQNGDVISGFKSFVGSKEASDELARCLKSDQTAVFSLNINGTPYAVTVAQSADDGNLAIVSISRSSDIYKEGYEFLSILIIAIVSLLVIIIGFVIYFIVSKVNVNRKISNMGIIDERLNCFTLSGFSREAAKSVERYKGSSFVVVSVGVRRFEYITEVSGMEGSVELLRKLRTTFNTFMKIGEVYGYDGHGEFLLLLQFKQKDLLIQRLRELYRTVYSGFSNQRYSVKLYFGIYILLSGDGKNMDRYISNAKLAMNNGGLEKMNGNYTMYDESVRNNYLQISDVEIRMDYGIRNREFKIFYQPKYSVDGDCIDGCEALVRWYDEKTESFRSPDSFLPMLEADGFISRLDHYVFLEVCKFISESVAKGLHVVPVSVNISRLTALEADFVEYYVNTKNHYKIPDKFITLELTETVAYENSKILKNLMKSLRENGFECSIDDFGVGYSSYDLLKQLDIDEVKLDKSFIEGCLVNPRARVILENTVQLVNKLGIKVTQEGVEDAQTFSYIKSIGCNVIQGYYYSKPINEVEFLKFIGSHG